VEKFLSTSHHGGVDDVVTDHLIALKRATRLVAQAAETA